MALGRRLRGGTSAGQPLAWLRGKARTSPDLLSQAPPWVRRVFDHAWAPMQALARQVSPLPPALCAFLMDHERGFVVISGDESR